VKEISAEHLCYNIDMHRTTDSVRIAIFDESDPDRFLVVTEADDLGNWKLPGGKFETEDGSDARSPISAALRELSEELNISIEATDLHHAGTLINSDGVSARHIFALVMNSKKVTPSREIDQSEWFTTESLPECKNREHILGAVASARLALAV